MTTQQARISIVITLLIGFLIALAGSHYSQELGKTPIFAYCVGLAFLINWLLFIPAFTLQTEKFFDLAGSFTYISVIVFALLFSENLDQRAILIALLVSIWAIRLGSFLFTRIHRTGKDDRFDKIKPNFIRFLNVWSIQALWVIFTAAAALVAISNSKRVEIDFLAVLGLAIWVLGFLIEVVADYQKSRFRKNPANKEKFITTGLWSRSRHPNYFGEIMLWLGIAIMAMPTFQGWQWVAIISPVFVFLLLTRLSGVPMLEAKAEKKWGDQEAYQAYKKNTPVLIPKLW